MIGCGIGGPAAGMALQYADIDAHLFEAREAGADDAGSFLNLASNGLAALRTLDAHRQVLDGALPTPRMVMWSHTGKRLGEVPNGIPLPDGTVSATARRASLHRALRDEALRRGVSIRWGKRLSSVDLTDEGVIAHFDDGSSADGDLLIGADGIHSKTRRLIDPSSPSPRYTGQLSIGGIARSARFQPTPGSYQMVFGKRAFFGFTTGPLGEAWWFANVAAPIENTSVGSDEWKGRLLELFSEDVGPARQMIAEAEEIGVYPIHEMPPIARWHRGSMVLLGDAIHATSPSAGQGAALAFEDAVALAKCLREESETGRAFLAYERLRRVRVERVVRASRRVGSTKVAGPVARLLRDLLMPTMLKLYARSKSHDWLYRYEVDWDETQRTREVVSGLREAR